MRNNYGDVYSNTSVLILGGGIAGCWTALKLLENNIPTTLMFYDKLDKGGKMGASKFSAGAINTDCLNEEKFDEWLENLGEGQGNSSVAGIIKENIYEELKKLKKFDPLKEIKLGLALKSGSGNNLLNKLYSEVISLGGRVINNAWVSRILIRDKLCYGVQYEKDNKIAILNSQYTVIASGGYASLFNGSVNSGTFGSIHGRFLMAGGVLSNMEFVFKHGYGQPDLGKLTPTEDLPGVEIYNQHGDNVEWLEIELFEGRGTNNHFEALKIWRKEDNNKYYIDFRFRKLYLIIKKVSNDKIIREHKETLILDLLKQCLETKKEELRLILEGLLNNNIKFDFLLFNKIKDILSDQFEIRKERIKHISYFSMGGIAHNNCVTNFENVFVNGEAMHDFGAFRVGGLPWALYISSAKKIASLITQDLSKQKKKIFSKFPVSTSLSYFDKSLFNRLRKLLTNYQEGGISSENAIETINWVKKNRFDLINSGRELDDMVPYLLVAESIMLSSFIRQESRGCFFRADFVEKNPNYDMKHTITKYNTKNHEIMVELVSRDKLSEELVKLHSKI